MYSTGSYGFLGMEPCGGDTLGSNSGIIPGAGGARPCGGGGARRDPQSQVSDALQSISQALTQMQQAMCAMNTKMQRTDDTIRCVAQRLKTQGATVQNLHSRMTGLEKVATTPFSSCLASRMSRPCSSNTEMVTPASVLKMEETCCDDHDLIVGRLLLRAAQSGKTKYVRKLLAAGADVNFSHKSKWTPLHLAAAKGNEHVVCLLLKHYADVNIRNCYGFTALHIAAYHDYSGRCAKLLIQAGAEVDARNRSGRCPLHYAAESGNVAVVRALKEAGANQFTKDDSGNVPYDVAKTVCVRRLLRPCSQGRRARSHAEMRFNQFTSPCTPS